MKKSSIFLNWLSVLFLFTFISIFLGCASRNVSDSKQLDSQNPKVVDLIANSRIESKFSKNAIGIFTDSLREAYHVNSCEKCTFYLQIDYGECLTTQGIFNNFSWPLSALTVSLFPFRERVQCESKITLKKNNGIEKSAPMRQAFLIYKYYPTLQRQPIPENEIIRDIDATLVLLHEQIN